MTCQSEAGKKLLFKEKFCSVLFFKLKVCIYLPLHISVLMNVCLCTLACGSPETGVMDHFKVPCGYWETNLRLLQEHLVVLNTEPFLQPQKTLQCFQTKAGERDEKFFLRKCYHDDINDHWYLPNKPDKSRSILFLAIMFSSAVPWVLWTTLLVSGEMFQQSYVC